MATHIPELPPAEVNLRDYLDVLRRRKAIMLQTFVVVLAVGIITTLLAKPVYETSAKLLVVAGAPQVSILNVENPLGHVLAQAQPDSVATQVETLQSAPFVERAIQEAGPPRGGDTADQSIKVAIVEGTNVIQVKVQSRDPRYAQKLANTIVDLHNRETKALSGQHLEEMHDFIAERAQEAEKKLAKTENRLGWFKRKHNIDELLRNKQLQNERRTDLERRAREVELSLVLTRTRLDEYRKQLMTLTADTTGTTSRENPRYQRLAEQLATAEENLDSLRAQFNEDSSPIQDAKAKIAELDRRLGVTPKVLVTPDSRPNPLFESVTLRLNETETEVRSLEAQHAKLQSELGQQQTPNNLPRGWEITLGAMQRERTAAEKAFTDLSIRKGDLEIRQKGNPPQNRVIESAGVPFDPVRPKKATNILLSIVLALCLGLAMAFLQEYMDDRINSPEDADRAAHLPLLGHVPIIPEKEPTVVTNLPARSHVAEAYRTLRSSIGFAAVDGELHTLMVTSPSKGEGKTVTSLNLAIAMALDGKSVILVDADLRRPNIHKHMRLPQAPGLTDALVAQKEVSEVLNPTEVTGLRVMTAGPIPPNPAELLNSQPMDRVIETMRGMADVVIFDTAPCIPVSDSIVLSPKVDGVVLVIHAGETKKAAVKHTRELLDRARARTVGLVFNRVPQRRGGYYYYYYYYYGGYYDESPEDQKESRRRGRRRSEPGSGTAGTSAMVRAESEKPPRAPDESGHEEAS